MKFNFPKHLCNRLTIDCKKDANECNKVAVNLISCNFHIVDVVIDNTYKYRADRSDGMNDVQWKVKLSPCKNGSVKRKYQASEQ
jgi:hypothetical protein